MGTTCPDITVYASVVVVFVVKVILIEAMNSSRGIPGNEIINQLIIYLRFSYFSDTSSPLVNVLLCPLRAEAWDCVRQQAGRMLLQLDEQLTVKSEELKGNKLHTQCNGALRSEIDLNLMN